MADPAPTPAPATSEREPPTNCRHGELELEVLNALATCREVERVAARYDLQGPKVQEIDHWTCATGTAGVRPIIYTCTLGDKEFVAKERR